MSENENVIQTEIQPEVQPEVEPEVQPEAEPEVKPETPKKKKKDNGGTKEWWRKRMVNLKRKPQNIPIVFLVVALVVYLIELTNFSKCVYEYNVLTTWAGLAVFVCTLLSLLVLVSYLRIFPKHKKPSIAMMVVTYVFIALMVFMDIVFYVEISGLMATNPSDAYPGADSTSLAISIVHIVFLLIAAILLATLPFWRKLLMKINTRKEIESASSNMDSIDLQGEE